MPRHKRHKFISWPIALLVALTLLLGACGSNATAPTATLNPKITAAVQLPSTEITVNSNSSTSSTLSGATVTPVIAPTSTADAGKPITQNPASPTPGVTATPTPRLNAEKLDRVAELRIIKAAYDAINQNLFREPNNPVLLVAALAEVGSITGISPPQVVFDKNVEGNWNIFNQAFNKILDATKDFKYPKNQLAHRVVNVLANEVKDEHTYFLDNSNYQSRQNLLSGNNTSIGFGVLINTQEDKAFVVRVVPGGPADTAGVKPGDQLVQYDTLKINDKNWTSIRNAAENETHVFGMSRTGEAKLLLINVTKQKYTLPTVEYRLINRRIGYIAIRDFFVNVADEVDRAMTELRKQGATSWILDVRENSGGVNVEQVAGRFISAGEIMGYNSNRKEREPMKVSNDLQTGPSKGKPLLPILPMVLLMDEISASSSEILALTVHDFQLGPLIGVKTAGALGHTVAYPLGDGTAISVTIDEYESKNGTKANGTGVVPDMIVERTIQDLTTGRDPQLNAGVGYLEKILAKK